MKAASTGLMVGDRVLVKDCTPKAGPGKLRSYYEDQIYIVKSKKGELHVYVVCPENGKGRERVLHHNLLFPCDSLVPQEPKPETGPNPNQRLRTTPPSHSSMPTRQRPVPRQVHLQSDLDSSDEEEEMYFAEFRRRGAQQADQRSNRPSTPLDAEAEGYEGLATGTNVQEPDQMPGHTEQDPVTIPSVENQPSTQGQNGQGGVEQPDQGVTETFPGSPFIPPPTSPENGDRVEGHTHSMRPRRETRPPRTFTYNEFGSPDPHCMTMNAPGISSPRYFTGNMPTAYSTQPPNDFHPYGIHTRPMPPYTQPLVSQPPQNQMPPPTYLNGHYLGNQWPTYTFPVHPGH